MLYVTATPIGNLQDVSFRAFNLFKEAEIIICEDTRQIQKLFSLLGVEAKPSFVNLSKNQEFNFNGVNKVMLELANKKLDKVLLVTDAGMPGLSDPGFEVVRLAQNLEVEYTVLPGANAILPAVVASGLVGKEFTFLGFLPIKKGRLTAWKYISQSKYPIVIYESVHRLEKFLEEAQIYLKSDRRICICKDISKLYENYWISSVEDLIKYKFNGKGEYAIVIEKDC